MLWTSFFITVLVDLWILWHFILQDIILYIMRQINHMVRYVSTKSLLFGYGEAVWYFFKIYFGNNLINIRKVCKCMVDVRSATRGAWQDHVHFLFRKLLQENGCVCFHNSFCIKYAVIQNISENFFEHARPPRRAWQGPTHFLLKKLFKENG